MRDHTLREIAGKIAIGAGLFLLALAASTSANAGSMHQGSAGSSGTVVTGTSPGSVLWAYYLTTEAGSLCPPATGDVLCDTAGDGDNILRLVNPNGAANGNLAGAKAQTVCAMIYVFDDDEEMGECCGCPLSSAQLTTFSVEGNLTSDWAVRGGPEAGDHGNGAIAIVAATQNAPVSCLGHNRSCNGGCDPTNVPGYSVTSVNNLLGSITHNQMVQAGPIGNPSQVAAITEIGLSDDGGGDPSNLIYLQSQCGALIGNGSFGGLCTCPVE